MKKIALFLILSLSIALHSIADEGMWLPQLLGQQVYNDMVKKGLKLTKEQLYSVNKNSLKDAIIIFGGGCTGEIVSPQGLIFTNHHCGYDAIASASTVEHNYLKDGFYARNMGEEIKTRLSVQFLLRIEDVSNEVNNALAGLSGKERADKQREVMGAISKRMSDADKFIEARVSPIFKGNQYLVFVYERYNDVRLVGTPPENIGKFGGDSDNWEWPRHTGDFSVFRVYAGKDNKPANYDVNNVPLKPKWYLPVSLKGVKEGSFAMIWGYPGGTNRYESSYGIKLATDINNPSLVELRDVRLKYMREEMVKDPAIKLKLASSYAGIANYWKFYDGETKQLLKFDVFGQKKAAEEKFIAWAKGKPGFENIFSEWKAAYDKWLPFAKQRMYISQGIKASPLIGFVEALSGLRSALNNPSLSKENLKKTLERATAMRNSFLLSEDKPSDEKFFAAATRMFYQNIAKNQQPKGFYEMLAQKYGPLDDDNTYKKYAADVFGNTIVLNDAKWNTFIANPDVTTFNNDPAYRHYDAFVARYNAEYEPLYQEFEAKNNDLGRLYIKGEHEMNPAQAAKTYPDATFTMRVSYGSVQSYSPRDGVFYDFLTTSKGVLEKYKPGDYEFDLTAKQIELLRKKDFGQYADPVRKDLVVGFITNNDITGGNSGSPVLNDKGELIGLAFDGNYEALSHKLAFDKTFNRTINVDIRYVLWCIDKLGGAKNIINELKLVR